MNPFVSMLASDSVQPATDIAPRKFDIDDNVGEGIHIHLRNLRIDMSVAEFDTFASELAGALEVLNDGSR